MSTSESNDVRWSRSRAARLPSTPTLLRNQRHRAGRQERSVDHAPEESLYIGVSLSPSSRGRPRCFSAKATPHGRKKIAEASRVFEENQKLEPAMTTFLNLANYGKKLGQVRSPEFEMTSQAATPCT